MRSVLIIIIIFLILNNLHAKDQESEKLSFDSNYNKQKETYQNKKNEEAEKLINRRIKLLIIREKDFYKRELEIKKREKELIRREKELLKREEILLHRENILTAREKNLNRYAENPHLALQRNKAPSIVGKYAVVADIKSGAFLHEKNAHIQTPVASTQKLLTALLIIQAGNLKEKIKAYPSDANVPPANIGIIPGNTYSRDELLHALLIKSGNDVAHCLARDHSGTIENFASQMNQKAIELGMLNTHFINPHGLPANGQYSTASDMALLAIECYKNPTINEIIKKKEYHFPISATKKKLLKNTNKLLKLEEKCNGMKTGYTRASGNCLISSGKKAQKQRIVVVIKSTRSWIWKDSRVLLNWALKQ